MGQLHGHGTPPVVGADVVALAPRYDQPMDITAMLATVWSSS